MENGRRPENPENQENTIVLNVNSGNVFALREIRLPQRSEGCGPMAGFYRNVPDEQLPWYEHHLDALLGISGSEEVLLSSEVRNSLVNMFGQIIVGIRQGKSLTIAVEKEKR